jgi:predicted Rossmann fold nucleotide-binding protein DprA/Smf involved in DNA uptake
MIERIAIIGSREFGSRGADEEAHEAVRAYVSRLPPSVIVISGGARGVDEWAVNAAAHRGLIRIIVMPAWVRADGTRDMTAGFHRNSVIADLCDRMVAFRRAGGSRGTDHAIRCAQRRGKTVEVVERRVGDPRGSAWDVRR